jgi:hypothetical protein
MKMMESASRLPLRTLMVCFTLWLIVTETLFFDQLKFNTRIDLLEQAARPLRGPDVIVPSERSAHVPSNARMQRL